MDEFVDVQIVCGVEAVQVVFEGILDEFQFIVTHLLYSVQGVYFRVHSFCFVLFVMLVDAVRTEGRLALPEAAVVGNDFFRVQVALKFLIVHYI